MLCSGAEAESSMAIVVQREGPICMSLMYAEIPCAAFLTGTKRQTPTVSPAQSRPDKRGTGRMRRQAASSPLDTPLTCSRHLSKVRDRLGQFPDAPAFQSHE